jgi:hypothetical protein
MERKKPLKTVIIMSLKKHLPSLGMPLMVFGGIYLISAYLALGLWPPAPTAYEVAKGGDIAIGGLTWQQLFSFHYGWLQIPLFVLSLCSLIIGMILLRYSE